MITAYTCNFYYLVFSCKKRNKLLHPETVDLGTPSVTIQLPIYNEKYVAKRLVDAVCNLDYPKNQMNIMVLDDSDDDTVDLLRKNCKLLQNTRDFKLNILDVEQERGTKQVLSNMQCKLLTLNL